MGACAPLIPPARRGGNRRHVDVREVMNGGSPYQPYSFVALVVTDKRNGAISMCP